MKKINMMIDVWIFGTIENGRFKPQTCSWFSCSVKIKIVCDSITILLKNNIVITIYFYFKIYC